MVILITGATHTGKTVLAQKMLERYGYPYLSIDHLKMGLIRSGQTDLTVEDDDALIPSLFDIVEHEDGHRFMNAASRLSKIARAEDVQRARRTYGGVTGEMRSAMKAVIEGIIRRNPSLEAERGLLLSIPVIPDEDAFDRFLTNATDYIDVRYRRNVFPKRGISAKVRSNVADALAKIRRRLYNEADNLAYYDLDKSDRFEELSGLLAWASADLEDKSVFKDD